MQIYKKIFLHLYSNLYHIVMKAKLLLQAMAVAIVTIIMAGCATKGNQATDQATNQEAAADTVRVSGTACDLTLGGIRFTRALNGADTLVTEGENGEITFRSEGGRDFFRDPNGSVSDNAPILLTCIDNTKPFTLQARIRPQFTKQGTYNAGVLYLYAHDLLWQKFCFEQDERGNHRVVTVRTIGTSDDNNHEVVRDQDYVYFKYSSDTKTIGSYFSLDGKEWQMVRLYRNEYPDSLWVGISNQCPKDAGSISTFAELQLTQQAVSDFRMGN